MHSVAEDRSLFHANLRASASLRYCYQLFDTPQKLHSEEFERNG
jgi:hypothetical protein